MIRKLCDYQSRLAEDEHVLICYKSAREGAHRKIYKDDVLVPCGKFLEINSPNTQPFMLNTDRIVWVTIMKERRNSI